MVVVTTNSFPTAVMLVMVTINRMARMNLIMKQGPMIELDEETDTENEDKNGDCLNSQKKYDHFYHEDPSFSSKINMPMDTSESTGTSHLETSRRQESVNQSGAVSNAFNKTGSRPTNESNPSLYFNDYHFQSIDW